MSAWDAGKDSRVRAVHASGVEIVMALRVASGSHGFDCDGWGYGDYGEVGPEHWSVALCGFFAHALHCH